MSERQSAAAFARLAFKTLLSRAASAEELELCVGFLTDQRQLLAQAETLTSFGLGEPAPVPPSSDPAQRAREGLILTLLNHNEFLTIR